MKKIDFLHEAPEPELEVFVDEETGGYYVVNSMTGEKIPTDQLGHPIKH